MQHKSDATAQVKPAMALPCNQHTIDTPAQTNWHKTTHTKRSTIAMRSLRRGRSTGIISGVVAADVLDLAHPNAQGSHVLSG